MRYMIISASGGILGDAFSCDKLEVAIAKGKALWKELTGSESMHEYQGISVDSIEEMKEMVDESYDIEAGAVRGLTRRTGSTTMRTYG